MFIVLDILLLEQYVVQQAGIVRKLHLLKLHAEALAMVYEQSVPSLHS